MKVLLTTIGSRGDVQPILALALELRALGHSVLICTAPNFQTWIESFGIDFFPLGPDLKKWTSKNAQIQKTPKRPSNAQARALARQTVEDQFRVLAEAAQGCDLIVGATTLQLASRSIAEKLKIPYVYASYCPAALPSVHHPPAKMGSHYPQSLPTFVNQWLWLTNNWRFNYLFRDVVNEQRATLGLQPVRNISQHIFTDRPWLAADPVLGPAPTSINLEIRQTGAWLLSDPNPLPDDLETFLAEGEPPLYFGFGSMRGSDQTGRVLMEAIRTLGCRAIISRGWGEISVNDTGNHCLSIGDVNHEKLFPRVAAIVHHGGAGTTTAAARAGKPQVIIPHLYDQYYWAQRVQALGVGVASRTSNDLKVDTLVDALYKCLKQEKKEHAEALANRIEPHGAHIAAEQLSKEFS